MDPAADIAGIRLGRRARVYRLLADCYLTPGPDLPRTVKELARLVGQLEPDLIGQAEGMADFLEEGRAGQDLALDHARLFVGPFSLLAPPYGSVYLEQEGRVMGRTTAEAREFYLAEGLDLAEDFSHPADHITVELEFIHYLAVRQRGASAEGDPTEIERLERQRQKFIDLQLKPWLGRFVECVLREAGTSFYRSLAGLTKGMVEKEGSCLRPSSIPVEASGATVRP